MYHHQKWKPWYISARSLQCQQNILKLPYILTFSQKIFNFQPQKGPMGISYDIIFNLA